MEEHKEKEYNFAYEILVCFAFIDRFEYIFFSSVLPSNIARETETQFSISILTAFCREFAGTIANVSIGIYHRQFTAERCQWRSGRVLNVIQHNAVCIVHTIQIYFYSEVINSLSISQFYDVKDNASQQ